MRNWGTVVVFSQKFLFFRLYFRSPQTLPFKAVKHCQDLGTQGKESHIKIYSLSVKCHISFYYLCIIMQTERGVLRTRKKSGVKQEFFPFRNKGLYVWLPIFILMTLNKGNTILQTCLSCSFLSHWPEENAY